MGAQNRVENANPGQERQVKCYNCKRVKKIGHIARNCTQPKRPQNFEYFKDKMLLMQAQENGVALDEEQLLFLAGGQDNAVDEDVDEQPVQDLALNVDNVFQADDRDAFDSDVDEAPTAQTMFMANLSARSCEENLKKELHSVKLQLASTINHHKSMVEEVTSLKKDFKQKENKYLEEFLDMKALKEKVKDKLYKQDQSLQTVHINGFKMYGNDSKLNVSSFTEMHDAHTSLKARCLELKVELSNLRDKIQKDNHDELIKRFSNLEVNHLNLQLKYQNLKESFGNNTSPPARDVPDFDLVFVIDKIKPTIQERQRH
ncbi:retrovirus-related pol polyprotein from transposon TNT 1-94 [Tanacetum coccineum]